MPCFPKKINLLCEQFQYNLALFVLTQFNSLTEDFTGGFHLSIRLGCSALSKSFPDA